MKCYVHTDKDAVGVCSVCGQGVCESCAVKVSNKLYCRECIDKKLTAKKAERPASLTFLAVLLGLGGAVNIVDGFSMIQAYIIWAELAYGGYTQLLIWGSLEVILGLLLFLATYYIWNLKRKGGLIGAILVFISLMFNISTINEVLFGTYGIGALIYAIIGLIVNIMILLQLRKNWGRLQ